MERGGGEDDRILAILMRRSEDRVSNFPEIDQEISKDSEDKTDSEGIETDGREVRFDQESDPEDEEDLPIGDDLDGEHEVVNKWFVSRIQMKER